MTAPAEYQYPKYPQYPQYPQYPVGPDVEEQRSLSEYFDIIKRRRKPFLFTLLGILFSTAVFSVALPSVYRSSATILIEQQDIPKELVSTTITSFADQRVQVISQRVMTMAQLWDVINKYDLYPEIRDDIPREQLIEKMRSRIKIDMVSADVIDPRSGGKAKANIAFKVFFDYERDPRKAQLVANELTSLYLNENVKERTQKATEAAQFLEEESTKLEQQINQLEERLARFKEGNIGLLPEQIEMNLQIMDRTERELLEIDRRIETLQQQNVLSQAQLSLVKPYLVEDNTTLLTEKGERVLSPEGRVQVLKAQYVALVAKYSEDHPDVIKVRRELEALGGSVNDSGDAMLLRDNLALAETELAQARERYAEDHPTVKRLQTKVSRLRDELAGKAAGSPGTASQEFNKKKLENPAYVQLKSTIQANAVQIQGLTQQRAELKRRVDEFQSKLGRAPAVEQEYRQLTRDHENSMAKYKEVRAKLQAARMAEALESEQKGERFTLIEPPIVPITPVKPNRPVILLLGTLLALGAAFGLAYFLDSQDNSIGSLRALMSITGEPPLVVIPRIYKKSEEEELAQRRRNKQMIYGGIGLSILFVALVVHFLVMPLDVLWFHAARELQLLFMLYM